MRKKWKAICGAICILGLLLILGTAGASDCGNITIGRAIIQSAIGLSVFAGAGYLGGYIQ